jgi:hypothetical protein
MLFMQLRDLVPALGFDLSIELTTTVRYSRLGRGTKPNNQIADLNPTYNRNKSSAKKDKPYWDK